MSLGSGSRSEIPLFTSTSRVSTLLLGGFNSRCAVYPLKAKHRHEIEKSRKLPIINIYICMDHEVHTVSAVSQDVDLFWVL